MDSQLSLYEKAVLELIKIGICTSKNDFDFSLISAEDWRKIMKESKVQAVSLMCFNATEKNKQYIPKDIFSKWFNSTAKGLIKNSFVLKSQERLIEILNENNLSYIILKGYASASYYPDFEKREFGDVDFLILPSQQEEVEKALVGAGYSKELENHDCHRVFRKKYEHLEMHFQVSGIPDGIYGEYFKEFLDGAADKFFVNNDPVFRNPVHEIHAVVILLHTIHHMLGEGIGLRHLCDWACFVNKTYNEPFWDETLLPLLEKTGTLKFVSALTKTCAVYLGTVCPNWAEDISDDLCAEIIKDIFSSGNFGRKNKIRSQSGILVSRHGKGGTKDSKFKNQMYVLDKSIYSKYPLVKKWKILYPFVLIYRVFRYLFLMLLGTRTSIIKSNSYANERKAIYSQFELYEKRRNK